MLTNIDLVFTTVPVNSRITLIGLLSAEICLLWLLGSMQYLFFIFYRPMGFMVFLFSLIYLYPASIALNIIYNLSFYSNTEQLTLRVQQYQQLQRQGIVLSIVTLAISILFKAYSSWQMDKSLNGGGLEFLFWMIFFHCLIFLPLNAVFFLFFWRNGAAMVHASKVLNHDLMAEEELRTEHLESFVFEGGAIPPN